MHKHPKQASFFNLRFKNGDAVRNVTASYAAMQHETALDTSNRIVTHQPITYPRGNSRPISR